MADLRNAWTMVLMAIVGLFVIGARSDGLAISYCSPENSGEDGQKQYNEYQSNGACQTTCQGAFAFAVVQGYYCWCSNYAPSDQVNTLECNQDCPGFETEWCGSTNAGLFGYYLLPGGNILGTAGGYSSSARATSSSSVSTTRKTSVSSSYSSQTHLSSSYSPLTVVTPTQSSTSSSIRVATSSSTSPRIVFTAPSSFSDSPTYYSPSPSPTYQSYSSEDSPTYATPTSESIPTAVYTSYATLPGSIRTILVTPTPSPTPSGAAALGQTMQTHNSGIHGGAIAGVVIGSLLGVALLAAGFWLLFFRRRRQNHTHDITPDGAFTPPSGTSNSNNIPSRQMSQMSSAGLLGKAPRLQTTGLAPGNDLRSADTVSSNFDRRSVGTDQRLNPYAIYFHEDARLSGVSLQDNHDYSRQLRIANPDP